MDIDYRNLLMKYICHVGSEEGATFLRHKSKIFNDDEWQELLNLDHESDSLYTTLGL